MPDNKSLNGSLLASVDKQVLLARKRGPSHESGQTVLHYRRLWTAALQALDELRRSPAHLVGLTAKEVAQLSSTLQALATMLGENFQAYVKTAAQVAVGRRDGVLYSPECHRCTAEVWEMVSMTRTMLTDVLETNDPAGGPTREAFAVGVAIRSNSPVDVLRVAEQHLAAFNNPVIAAHLEDHGAPVAILCRQLAARLAGLDAALNAGPAQHLAELRRQRDDHAMRVEIVAARMMVTISALFGRAKRDEFRALMPVRRRPRRTVKQNALLSARAANGSTVQSLSALPVKDSGPAGANDADKDEVPARGAMFGSRTVTLLIASPAVCGDMARPTTPINGTTTGPPLSMAAPAGLSGSGVSRG